MADITATTAATYLPRIYSETASIIYAANLVIAPKMDRRWEKDLKGGGDRTFIPQFTEGTTGTKRSTFGTGASVTFRATTESQTTLSVNVMVYDAIQVPVELTPQLYANYVQREIQKIGQSCAGQVETDLAADDTNGFDSFTAVGTDNVDVTESIVLDAETVLNNANAPDDDRYFFVSPATRQSLMGIEVFRNSLYATSTGGLKGSAGTKGRGYIGSVLSLGVYMTNKLEAGTSGKKNFIGQREAIALALQKEVKVVKQLDITAGLFDQYAGYITYGFVAVKTNHGREVDGK